MNISGFDPKTEVVVIVCTGCGRVRKIARVVKDAYQEPGRMIEQSLDMDCADCHTSKYLVYERGDISYVKVTIINMGIEWLE